MSQIITLAPELRCHLRAGITITSFAQCVEELVHNSLDAGSSCIAVRVDLNCGRVQVVDNGCGISREDLGLVSCWHSTSKCNTHGGEDVTLYGCHGEALASIRDLCQVLEISTRHKLSTETYICSFRLGEFQGIQRAPVQRPSCGTTVTIMDLFNRYPVRKKYLSDAVELESICLRIKAICLMCPEVSFSLRNDANGRKLLQTHKTNSTASAFSSLFGKQKHILLKEIKHDAGGFTVHAFLSPEAHQTKDLQFFYINQRLIDGCKLDKFINQLLIKTLFAKNKSKGRAMEGSQNNHDKYPVYVINVTCSLTAGNIDSGKSVTEFVNWSAMFRCIEMAVKKCFQEEDMTLSPHAQTDSTESQLNCLADCTRSEKEAYGESICTTDLSNSLHSGIVRRRNVQKGNSSLTPLKPTVDLSTGIRTYSTADSEKSAPEDSLICSVANTTTTKQVDLRKMVTSKNTPLEASLSFSSPEGTSTSLSKSAVLQSFQKSMLACEAKPCDEINSVSNMVLFLEDSTGGSTEGTPFERDEVFISLSSSTVELSMEAIREVSSRADDHKIEVMGTTMDSIRERLERKPKGQTEEKAVNLKKSSSPSHITKMSFWHSEKVLLGLNRTRSELHKKHVCCCAGKKGLNSGTEAIVSNENVIGRVCVERSSLLETNKDDNTTTQSNSSSADESFIFMPACQQVTGKLVNICSVPNDVNSICEQKSFTDSLLQTDILTPMQSSQPRTSLEWSPRKRKDGIMTMDLMLQTVDSIDFKTICPNPGSDTEDSKPPAKRMRSFCNEEQNTNQNQTEIEGGVSDKQNTSVISDKKCNQSTVKCKNNAFWPSGSGSSNASLEKGQNDVAPSSDDVKSKQNMTVVSIVQNTCHISKEENDNGNSDTSEQGAGDNKMVLSEDQELSSNPYQCCRLTNKCSENNNVEDIQMEDDMMPAVIDEDQSQGFAVGGESQTFVSSSDPHGFGVQMSPGGSTKQTNLTREDTSSLDKDHLDILQENVIRVQEEIKELELNKNTNHETGHSGLNDGYNQDSSTTEAGHTKSVDVVNMEEACCREGQKFTDTGSPSHVNIRENKWIRQVDSSGQTVYINLQTGFSRYTEPPTSPRSNTVTYTLPRGHPMRQCSNSVLQNFKQNAGHLTAPRTNTMTSTPKHQDEMRALLDKHKMALDKEDYQKWTLEEYKRAIKTNETVGIKEMFSKWNNPVTSKIEQKILNIERVNMDQCGSLVHQLLDSYKLNKDILQNVQVLGQLDRKFILCLVKGNGCKRIKDSESLLILIDQHAAHERIRLENFLHESFDIFEGHRQYRSLALARAIEMTLTADIIRIMCAYKDQFSHLGLQFSLVRNREDQILVHAVPECLVLKGSDQLSATLKIADTAENFIKEQAHLFQVTHGACPIVPNIFIKCLASRSCHGSIKFGDKLAESDCIELITSLVQCDLPFQCAHGRPSVIPLLDLGKLAQVFPDQPSTKPQLSRLSLRMKKPKEHSSVKMSSLT